ncbi:hypothetical protein PSYMO_37751, partial [Pseudomonas amygdali pv. mori str. 301020]
FRNTNATFAIDPVQRLASAMHQKYQIEVSVSGVMN